MLLFVLGTHVWIQLLNGDNYLLFIIKCSGWLFTDQILTGSYGKKHSNRSDETLPDEHVIVEMDLFFCIMNFGTAPVYANRLTREWSRQISNNKIYHSLSNIFSFAKLCDDLHGTRNNTLFNGGFSLALLHSTDLSGTQLIDEEERTKITFCFGVFFCRH